MNEAIQQHQMDATTLEPSGPFISAGAALNWIAFRRAEDRDLTGRQSLQQEFGPNLVLPPEVGDWDYVIAEAAGSLSSEHHLLMQQCVARIGREPKNLQAMRDAVARKLIDRGWRAIDLHIYLIGRKEAWARRERQVGLAQHELTVALSAEKLGAIATRATPAEPERGFYFPRPIGSASQVPWLFFLTAGATVNPSGAITSGSDVGYLDARFRSVDVLRVWPAMSFAPESAIDEVAQAQSWMAKNVTSYRAKQRDRRVGECAQALGIGWDAALAGWGTLHEAIKGKARGSAKPKLEG